MSEMPEIGSKISLISKADIRYEGNLFTVNPTECTIALANVRSFGTEDREVENVVPAHSGTYEFIMFRGSDIKDIKVVSNQMPMNDPAIVDYTGGPSSMKAPGYHHQPPSQLHHDSYNPMTSSAFPQAGGLYNPMAGMGRTIMKPQQLQQQSELIQLQQQQQQQQQLHQQQQHLVAQQHQPPLQPQPPPPIQQQPPKEPEPSGAILDLISGGGGSRSSTPGLLSGSSRKSPTIDQGIQVSGHHKGVSFGGQQHLKDDNKRANNRQDGNRRGGGSGAIGDGGYNKSRGGGRGGGNNSGGGGGDNKEYRPQRRETFSLNHIRPSMQDQQGGGGMRQQQHQQQNNRDRDNQQQQQQRGGWGGQRGGNQGGYNNQGGGNQGQGGNRQRGRGGGRSQQGAGNFNRAPGQQLQPGNNAQKNKLKFESDYDFDKANNEFEELRSQIAKVKIGDSDATPAEAVNGDAAPTVTEKKDDSAAGNETGVGGEGGGEHHEEGGEGDANAPIYYDKAKSFFDNISCEAVERSKGRSQRTDWRTERKLNSETFGVASARRGNFRGRGGYYGGGGRGGNQGYHRGGGYNNRNYNNNHNWQRYNNRSLHQPLAAGSGDPA